MAEIPVDLVRRTFETNVFANLDLTQHVIRKRGRGVDPDAEQHPAAEDPQRGLGGPDDRIRALPPTGRSAAARAARWWRDTSARRHRSCSGAVKLR
jgi:hypothetical protein